MQTLMLALLLCLQNALPTGETVAGPRNNGSSVNVIGAWHGGLLPPGISGVDPFETVGSTITFRPDGTYTLRVAKPTGAFGGDGTYILDGDTLTLNPATGTASMTRLHVSRHGMTLTLQPVGLENISLTLPAGGMP